jgi:hypothetical protein
MEYSGQPYEPGVHGVEGVAGGGIIDEDGCQQRPLGRLNSK